MSGVQIQPGFLKKVVQNTEIKKENPGGMTRSGPLQNHTEKNVSLQKHGGAGI